MDDIDFQILKILQKKARVPNVEIARKVKMAPSAVLERIKKLETSGVIKGYEVRLNPDMFNCSTIVFVHIKLRELEKLEKITQSLFEIDQIQELHYLAGEDCLMAKIRVSCNAELENIIRTKIAINDCIKNIKTYIALSTYKESAKISIS